MSESLRRLRSLSLPKNFPRDIDLIRLINYKIFDNCIINENRCTIISLIAKGVTTALDIANALGSSRTAVYRHLNVLRRNGILAYKNGKFFIAARIFLVYEADVDSEGYIKIKIYPDRGGFVDEEVGFILLKGHLCICDACRAFESCLRAVKNLARKLEVKVRSEKPLDAFIEIAREIIYRDALNVIKNGYLVVKTASEPEEGGVGSIDEETSV